MCQVTMATAFEKANLHVQIAASLQYIILLLLLLLYVPLFIAVYSTWMGRKFTRFHSNDGEMLFQSDAPSGMDAGPVYRFPTSKYSK